MIEGFQTTAEAAFGIFHAMSGSPYFPEFPRNKDNYSIRIGKCVLPQDYGFRFVDWNIAFGDKLLNPRDSFASRQSRMYVANGE
jgi:hypothetical protein